MPEKPLKTGLTPDSGRSIPEVGADSARNPGGKPADDAKPKALTAEEQMAQFEEALKEEDWGHQPC
jgi:hypothetical protein